MNPLISALTSHGADRVHTPPPAPPGNKFEDLFSRAVSTQASPAKDKVAANTTTDQTAQQADVDGSKSTSQLEQDGGEAEAAQKAGRQPEEETDEAGAQQAVAAMQPLIPPVTVEPTQESQPLTIPVTQQPVEQLEPVTPPPNGLVEQPNSEFMELMDQQSQQQEVIAQPESPPPPSQQQPQTAQPEPPAEPQQTLVGDSIAQAMDALQEQAAAAMQPVSVEKQPAPPQDTATRVDSGQTVASYQPVTVPLYDERPLTEPIESEQQLMEIAARERVSPPPKTEKKPQPAAAEVTATTPPTPQMEQTAPASEAAQAQQIERQITENLQQQKMEFRMQLQPAELGKVDVKLALESGRLVVEIIASSEKSAELLSRQMETLVGSLRSADIQVESVQVVTQADAAEGQLHSPFQFGQQSQPETQQQNQAPHSPRRATASNGATQQTGTQPQQASQPNAVLDYTV